MGYVSAIVAAAGAIASSAQGANDARSASNARKRQGQAQELAKSEAASKKRQTEMDQNRANRKRPDIGQILAGAQGGAGGIDSTILTGPSGLGSGLGSVKLGG